MIGIDTNILLRYLLDLDDPEQAEAARSFVGAQHEQGISLFVNCIVVVELVWVLRRTYKIPETEIRSILTALLHAAEFTVERADAIAVAVRASPKGVGLADQLIASINAEAGCSTTATFDTNAAKHPGFIVLA